MSTRTFPNIATNMSTFPGMAFNPKDYGIKTGLKHDPMLAGVDIDKYDEIQKKIEKLIEDKLVPKSYSIHNEIHLETGRRFDTTNRNAVKWAKQDGFDKAGFKAGKPLLRDIFYRDPYVTCSNCNAINFIDVMAVRRLMQLPKVLLPKLPKEPIPKCNGCHRTDCFVVGVDDFSKDIEHRRQTLWLLHRRRVRAARLLQRAYRQHLRRMFGRAYLGVNFAHKTLLDNAASQINALARGRLGRRTYRTEKNLRVIRTAHPLLVKFALRPGGPFKVWWYKKEDEKLLYENYLELCERTGFSPPRFMVEQNIAEIARRIIERQNKLITIIQKYWRGFQARRVVRLYRYEIIRIRQITAAKAMKVQRLYRGHRCRLHVVNSKVITKRSKIMERYQLAMQQKKTKAKKDLAHVKCLGYYRRERAEERMGRCMSLLEPATAHGNRRLKAWSSSCYVDERVMDACVDTADMATTAVRDKKQGLAREIERKLAILDRVHELESSLFGNVSPLDRTSTSTSSAQAGVGDKSNDVQKLSSDIDCSSSAAASSSTSISSDFQLGTLVGRNGKAIDDLTNLPKRGQRMHTYFKAELHDLRHQFIERITHDFTRKDLLVRLKQVNKVKTKPGAFGAKARFKYPDGINDKPMEWLFEDDDD